MGFYTFLWWCPQMDDKFKEYGKYPTSKYLSHEIYVQNQIQPSVYVW